MQCRRCCTNATKRRQESISNSQRVSRSQPLIRLVTRIVTSLRYVTVTNLAIDTCHVTRIFRCLFLLTMSTRTHTLSSVRSLHGTTEVENQAALEVMRCMISTSAGNHAIKPLFDEVEHAFNSSLKRVSSRLQTLNSTIH